MKLMEKKRINSKYYKKYDSPRTPYDRVMASEYVSDEEKVAIAAKNGALKELMKNEDYKDKWEEIENVSAIIRDFKDGRVSPDGLSLSLNFLQEKVEKIEKDLKRAEKSGNEQTASLKKRELDGLFSARQEMAQKISGRDLRGEAENKKTIKEWEKAEGYLSDRERHIKENYEIVGREIKEERRKEINSSNLSDREKGVMIREIDAEGLVFNEEMAKKLLGLEVKETKGIKASIRAMFKGLDYDVFDKEGNKIRESKDIYKINNFLKEKVEESLKEKAGEEWDAKNNEREAEIRKLVEKEIKGLAKSPEKAEHGVETVYSRLKEKIITEFEIDGLKKEKKTREQLREIEKEFKGKGEDPTEFINDVLHREKGLENLEGDLNKEGGKDEQIIKDFLEDWGILVEPEKMEKFLTPERKKKYEKMVKERKGFLEWLFDLIFFLSNDLSEEKEKKQSKGKNKKSRR